MALDRTILRERLRFYRELGVGPLYRRETTGAVASAVIEAAPEIEVANEAVADESALMPRKAKPADRESQLRVILEDIGPNCQRCKLAKLGRKQIVFGTGDPHAELMFVGEGPGADEDAQGLPFVGRAGQLLTRMIEAMGYRRADVYIANVVKCRPPGNRNPEPDEMDACEPFLKAQIRAVAPKASVALGQIAAQTLLRDTTPISRLRGRRLPR